MKLITRWTLAASAAETWRRHADKGHLWHNADIRRVQAALDALGPSPSPQAVDDAVGRSVTTLYCDECEEAVEEAVLLADREHADGGRICAACLLKALQLVEP